MPTSLPKIAAILTLFADFHTRFTITGVEPQFPVQENPGLIMPWTGVKKAVRPRFSHCLQGMARGLLVDIAPVEPREDMDDLIEMFLVDFAEMRRQ